VNKSARTDLHHTHVINMPTASAANQLPDFDLVSIRLMAASSRK
jgi:hypothetical protein